jgi:hypothetical protein
MALSNLFSSMSGSAQVDPAVSAQQQTILQGLLTKDNSQVPGAQGPNLTPIAGQSATNYTGQASNANMAAIDPTSAAYENATSNAFLNRLNTSMAQARSGTDIVRGGTARQGFREGDAAYKANLERSEELRRAKVQDFGMQNAATNTAHTVESGRKGQSIQAADEIIKTILGQTGQGLDASQKFDSRRNMNIAGLSAALEALGIKNTNVNENLTGKGSQSGSNSGWEAGVSCCFIFLESYNGKLPWFVRDYRDALRTPRMELGYTRLARFLVPQMRRHAWVRELVNRWMVQPLTCYGGWFYRIPNYESFESYSSYKRFWFFVFNLLGA